MSYSYSLNFKLVNFVIWSKFPTYVCISSVTYFILKRSRQDYLYFGREKISSGCGRSTDVKRTYTYTCHDVWSIYEKKSLPKNFVDSLIRIHAGLNGSRNERTVSPRLVHFIYQISGVRLLLDARSCRAIYLLEYKLQVSALYIHNWVYFVLLFVFVIKV